MSRQLIIDTHAHFGVPENKVLESMRTEKTYEVDCLLQDLATLKEMAGSENGDLLEDHNFLEDYLTCMEENHVQMSWLHQLSFEKILGYQVLSNEQISQAIRTYPGKFRGFASVDPNQDTKAAVEELDHAIRVLGLHAFKLNPNDYGGFDLNDPEKLYPLYEKCCELNIPVSVHTGITPSCIFRMKHNNPILLDDVAVDFPDLVLIVEHMGHPWNDLCYNMVSRHKNMYLTITAVANVLIHSRPAVFRMELSKMIAIIGSEKILWGSDWTATPNMKEVLTYLNKVSIPLPMRLMMGVKQITKQDIDNIVGLNALRILK
ncbi:amidohydrolase family protein [Gorillibacterium sp. CAU 1737]|uniref:amidohydrolase family protein n=1 Tax=Gorillibacterium sp. CAU 1737 TaxID=3140362 RepID=UPI0032617849